MPTYDRQELIDLLQEMVITVNFTKLDGSARSMRCTLDEEYIPLEQRPAKKSKQDEVENQNIITAYDVENAGWRRFRIDSITEVVL